MNEQGSYTLDGLVVEQVDIIPPREAYFRNKVDVCLSIEWAARQLHVALLRGDLDLADNHYLKMMHDMDEMKHVLLSLHEKKLNEVIERQKITEQAG